MAYCMYNKETWWVRENKFIFIKGISIQKSKQNYKNKSNNVFAFVSQYLKKTDEDKGIKFKEIYNLYRSYCDSECEKGS